LFDNFRVGSNINSMKLVDRSIDAFIVNIFFNYYRCRLESRWSCIKAYMCKRLE